MPLSKLRVFDKLWNEKRYIPPQFTLSILTYVVKFLQKLPQNRLRILCLSEFGEIGSEPPETS